MQNTSQSCIFWEKASFNQAHFLQNGGKTLLSFVFFPVAGKISFHLSSSDISIARSRKKLALLKKGHVRSTSIHYEVRVPTVLLVRELHFFARKPDTRYAESGGEKEFCQLRFSLRYMTTLFSLWGLLFFLLFLSLVFVGESLPSAPASN